VEGLRRATDALDGDVPVETDAFVEDPADVLIRVSEPLDLSTMTAHSASAVRRRDTPPTLASPPAPGPIAAIPVGTREQRGDVPMPEMSAAG
jgi:hypothetical protein